MLKKNKATSPNEILCDICGRSFTVKQNLIKHLQMHVAQKKLTRTEGLTCLECNIVFKNRGLLVCHNVKIHNSNPNPKTPKPVKTVDLNKCKHMCQVCQLPFFHVKDMREHIREYHFNLLYHIPYYQLKKVNQVWFEKVLNSKNIVEIKKVAENILLIRKLDENTAIKVSDQATEVIDLHDLYPTQSLRNMQCPHCFKWYDRSYFNKHVNDVHLKYV